MCIRDRVEFALFGSFALPKDDEIVRPRQLSRQWCDNCVAAVCFIKLLHSKQVGAGETALPRLRLGDVLGQLRDHAFAPFGGFDLATDVLAYLPVEIYQRGIDGLKCPLPSGCNAVSYTHLE